MTSHDEVDKAASQLADTGERMLPSAHKGKLLYGEHLVRYEALLPFVKDKRVLDLASGSGYGTQALSTVAKHVYGVDYDHDAIAYAQANYGSKNIEYKQGDATKIPLPDNSIDVMVSLETIEHIEDYEAFLKEINRVLVDDGVAFISTPNDIESPEGNHYHVHEFDFAEAQSALQKHFKNVTPYFQGTWLYTALVDQRQLTTEWRGNIDTMSVAPLNIDTTMYYLFACSNSQKSPVVEPVAAIGEHWSVRKAIELEAAMRGHMDDQRKIIDHQQNQIDALTEQRAKLERSVLWRAYQAVKHPGKK